MITEAFLICALTLPAAEFKPITVCNTKVRAFDDLRRFVDRVVPGGRVILGHEPRENGKAVEKAPFKWRGKDVWIEHPKKLAIEMSA